MKSEFAYQNGSSGRHRSNTVTVIIEIDVKVNETSTWVDLFMKQFHNLRMTVSYKYTINGTN
jgi:hypothetical protein